MQAEHKKILNLLKTARGQLDGLVRMVECDRYCLDVSYQLSATQAILRKANREVLKAHLDHCIAEALSAPPQDAAEKERKLKELSELLMHWEKL